MKINIAWILGIFKVLNDLSQQKTTPTIAHKIIKLMKLYNTYSKDEINQRMRILKDLNLKNLDDITKEQEQMYMGALGDYLKTEISIDISFTIEELESGGLKISAISLDRLSPIIINY